MESWRVRGDEIASLGLLAPESGMTLESSGETIWGEGVGGLVRADIGESVKALSEDIVKTCDNEPELRNWFLDQYEELSRDSRYLVYR
jgi:hypothetical protein